MQFSLLISFFFVLFPVFRLEILAPLTEKKNLFWKPRTGEDGKGSLFGSLFEHPGCNDE